jgi:hypothetical protein
MQRYLCGTMQLSFSFIIGFGQAKINHARLLNHGSAPKWIDLYSAAASNLLRFCGKATIIRAPMRSMALSFSYSK